MKKILIAVATCIVSVAVSAAQTFPAQCKVSGLRYEKGAVVLFSQHNAKPRLYAIQNRTKKTILLTKKGNGGGMGAAGWDSQLSANRWSSILMTHPDFVFACHLLQKKGGVKKIPCQSVLRVCEFSHFYSKNPINGGYWVAEDMPLKALMARIHARGFEV